MQPVYRSPHPALAPFVRFLGYFRWDGPTGRERVLPTGELQLLVNLHEDELRTYGGDRYESAQRVGGVALQGVQARHWVIDTAQQASIALVSFAPGGAYPFFAAPPSATADQLVELDQLWGRDGATLRERLLDTSGPEQMLRVLETVLLQQVVHSLEPDPALRHAVAALDRGIRVADVTDHLGMNPKRFVRSFADRVGLTPKRFSRVRRFQHALGSIPHDRAVDWASIAATCGYFDQSHLVHEFRELAGITPSAYRPRSPAERNHVPL